MNYDYLVCTDCLLAIANDDYTGLDYFSHSPAAAAEREREIRAGIAALAADGNLTPADYSEDFSRTPCECCSEDLHGERHGINLIRA